MKTSLPAALLLVFSASLAAQERDGRVFVETPGIALVKPQPWSPASSAQVLRFDAYSDRRARGHGNQGYFEFRTAAGNATRQYQAAQVVEFIPAPEIPAEIRAQDVRDRLAGEAGRMAAIARAVPGAARDLGELLQPLTEAVAEFDSGKFRVNGKWVPKSELQRQDALRFSKALRMEMAQAKRKADFDLESNTYFVSLARLADGDPEALGRLEAFRSEHRALVEAEGIQEAVSLLRKPGTTPSEAALLLGRLRASESPGESAKLVLRQADAAAALATGAASVRDSLDAALGNRPPVVSPELAARIRELSAKANAYRAGNPPRAIPAPLAEAEAFSAFAATWPRTLGLMDSRDFSAASRELASLESRCALVGPNACAAISELKTAATIEVDKFQKLRREGEEALGAGNKAGAAEKFREALAVMPDAELESKLSQIQ